MTLEIQFDQSVKHDKADQIAQALTDCYGKRFDVMPSIAGPQIWCPLSEPWEPIWLMMACDKIKAIKNT